MILFDCIEPPPRRIAKNVIPKFYWGRNGPVRFSYETVWSIFDVRRIRYPIILNKNTFPFKKIGYKK